MNTLFSSSQAALYLVTKAHPNIVSVVDRAIEGGVSIVQLRDKDLSDLDFANLAKILQAIIGDRAIFLLNDRVHIAEQLGLGVHVGQDDMSPQEVRQRLGDGVVIGATVHDDIELAKRVAPYVNYVGVGPVYATQTKLDAKKVLGVDAVLDLAVQLQNIVPVVGIGGIDKHNTAPLRMLAGVAMCGAIMDAEDSLRFCQSVCAVLQNSPAV